MNGFGAALERAFIGAVILAVVVGGLVAIGLEHLVLWLSRHLSWSWS